MRIADIVQMEEVSMRDGKNPPYFVALLPESFEDLSKELSDPCVTLATSEGFIVPPVPERKQPLFAGRECKALIRDSYIFV